MALAPPTLPQRPVATLEQQPAASVSSVSLVSSSSSHGSISLFLHHRQPQSFRPAISRITQLQEYPQREGKASLAPTKRSSKPPPPWQQKKASNAAPNDKRFQNPPPWRKKSFDESCVDDSDTKDHNFRPAPWLQGSHKNSSPPPQDACWHEVSFDDDTREKVDGKPMRHKDAEADKSAMARIVEKLRTIQKAYDPVDSGQAMEDEFEDGGRTGQRVIYGSRELSSTQPSVSYNSGSVVGTWPSASYNPKSLVGIGQRTPPNLSDRARTGQRVTKGRSDGARTLQKVMGTDATETSPSNFSTLASAYGKGSSMQAELLVSKVESKVAKFPWEKDEEVQQEEVEQEEKLTQKKAKGPRILSLAERTLSPEELKRLRILGLQLPERLKIGKLGVTRSIIISIQEQFNTCELVKVRCEGPAAANIKKTHLELEEKTGGLVVLRTGKIIVVYRGSDYEAEQSGMVNDLKGTVETMSVQEYGVNTQAQVSVFDMRNYEGLVDEGDSNKGPEAAFINKGDTENHVQSKVGLVANAVHARMTADLRAKREADLEAESILEGLGPRFENWTGLLPIPIDADLLTPVIPNYRPPFRLMPYGVRPRLSNAELTDLRRRARPLAPHFVLGRNRGHHGLAAAIVKLWEKSEIAKIAVKKRVQNTNNLIMSDELKQLTGGILLSRDKFFVTLYRGKDFVPEKVAAALVEREASVRDLQESEEKAREERSITVKWTSATKPSMAVIGQEEPVVEPSWVHTMDVKEQSRLKREVAKIQHMALARKMEKKLHTALKKKEKAEQDLKKIEAFLKPVDRPIDVETITEEEKFMFRKLGLKMKAYLLLGRRGVFDGVVENMHLHWKHRELVKILVKEVDGMAVQEMARMLEYESGGVLVAVTPTKKGLAIIMYRGKNYQRPTELRPRNLLTKRKALKRSLELQRHESVSKNVKALEDQIRSIQVDLAKLSKADHEGSQEHDEGLSERLKDSDPDSPFLKPESDKVLNNEGIEQLIEEKMEPTVTAVMEAESMPNDMEVDRNALQERIKNLERLVRSGPIYRADRLTNAERLVLRKEALSSGKAPQFFVGKNNGLEGLARGIRLDFLQHDLVQIVVKGRNVGTLMEDLVHDLEELTGGVLVSQEPNKIIMYRGWPRGDEVPSAENLENLTPELLSALEAEQDWEEDGMEVDASKDDVKDEDEDEDDWSEGSELDDEDGEEDDQWTLCGNLDGHLKMDGIEEDDDDEDNEEEDDDEDDDGWDLLGQVDDTAEEGEEVEEQDEEDDEESDDQNSDWDFRDSDDDDAEDSDSVLFVMSNDDDDNAEDSDSAFSELMEETCTDGINGKSTSKALESW